MIFVHSVHLQQLLPIGRIELQGPLRCEIDFPCTSQRGIDDDGITSVKLAVTIQIQLFIVRQCRRIRALEQTAETVNVVLRIILSGICVARGRCGDLCVVQVHFPGAQVPLALAVRGLDQHSGQSTYIHKISDNVPVLRDCGCIYSVISVAAKAKAANIKTPHLLSGGNIISVHDQQLDWLAVAVMHKPYISAFCTCD